MIWCELFGVMMESVRKVSMVKFLMCMLSCLLVVIRLFFRLCVGVLLICRVCLRLWRNVVIDFSWVFLFIGWIWCGEF